MEFCGLEENLVYTDPFNFYYWRPNNKIIEKKKCSFVFSKPPGKPIVATVIGENIEVFCYETNDEISKSITLLLKENSLAISRIFGYPVAEILFFVEKNHFTFGMISSLPLASKKKEWFAKYITLYFEELMRIDGKN